MKILFKENDTIASVNITNIAQLKEMFNEFLINVTGANGRPGGISTYEFVGEIVIDKSKEPFLSIENNYQLKHDVCTQTVMKILFKENDTIASVNITNNIQLIEMFKEFLKNVPADNENLSGNAIYEFSGEIVIAKSKKAFLSFENNYQSKYDGCPNRVVCPECFKIVKDCFNFCIHCGAKLK